MKGYDQEELNSNNHSSHVYGNMEKYFNNKTGLIETKPMGSYDTKNALNDKNNLNKKPHKNSKKNRKIINKKVLAQQLENKPVDQ